MISLSKLRELNKGVRCAEVTAALDRIRDGADPAAELVDLVIQLAISLESLRCSRDLRKRP